MTYLGAAAAFSLAAVLALGVALEAETRLRRLLVPVLYAFIPIYVGVIAIVSGRDVSSPWLLNPSATATGSWLTRAAVAGALGICVVRVLAAVFTGENRGRGGVVLFAAFCLFFLTNSVLSSVFGTDPEFKHDLYYAPFLFAAVFASRNQDPEIAIRFAKCGLFTLLAASCIAGLVAPDLTIERRYAGWIPGLSIRFWGLDAHANVMGPVTLLYLLLEIHQPFRRRWLHYLGLVIGIVVLALAQSKTTWGAAALAAPALVWLRSPRKTGFTPSFVAACALGLGVLGALALFALPQSNLSVHDLMETTAGQEAASFTGRDTLWGLALHEWQRNPMFGYGVTMWNETYRLQVGLAHAYSAHNQFFQALSMAGAVGVAGTLVYLAVLTRYAIAARRASRGLSLVLCTVVLVRCVTETPLSIESVLNSVFLAHLLLFHIALAYSERGVALARPAPAWRAIPRSAA